MFNQEHDILNSDDLDNNTNDQCYFISGRTVLLLYRGTFNPEGPKP